MKVRIKSPAKILPSETYLEDTVKKKVHKGGNNIREYGRVYLPAEWIGRLVYIGVINEGK